MACSYRVVIGYWFFFVFVNIWPGHLFASEGQSIEENAIQIANKEVEARGIKLSYWKPPETGEKILAEWQRIRLWRRENSEPNQQEYLDNQERALAGKDFLAVRYLHKHNAQENVKHGEMWVIIDKDTGNVLLVIPPGY